MPGVWRARDQFEQLPPPRTLKNVSMSASVPRLPSALKSAVPQQELTARGAVALVTVPQGLVATRLNAAASAGLTPVMVSRRVVAPETTAPVAVGPLARATPLRRHW